jgi:hypothetical protein
MIRVAKNIFWYTATGLHQINSDMHSNDKDTDLRFKIILLTDEIPCRLVESYECVVDPVCLHLPDGKRRQLRKFGNVLQHIRVGTR